MKRFDSRASFVRDGTSDGPANGGLNSVRWRPCRIPRRRGKAYEGFDVHDHRFGPDVVQVCSFSMSAVSHLFSRCRPPKSEEVRSGTTPWPGSLVGSMLAGIL